MGMAGAAGASGASSAAAGSAAGAAGDPWGLVFTTALNLVQQKLQSDAQSRAEREREEYGNNVVRLDEEAALNAASEAMRNAKRDISQHRKEAEARRSAKRANWGGAGLLNSGSVALNQAADSVQDRLDADDMRFRAQQEVDRVLSAGRAKGNATRLKYGNDINKSTLSLGSKIYGPRR